MNRNAVTTASSQDLQQAERQARIDLAAAYRLVALFGWDDLVFTHLSMRVPGPEHHFLINPYGLMFEEITASSLVKVDIDGNKVEDSPYPVNPAGFLIHSTVHAAREDARCVIHVHSVNGVAVSAQEGGLLPISQQATLILTSLGYHDYEGIALNDDERPRLVRDLGTNDYLILRNHGLLTVGESPADAFLRMYLLEASCMIQVRAQSGGAALRPIDPAIVDEVGAATATATLGQFGGIAWPGLLRRLDRRLPGYAD